MTYSRHPTDLKAPTAKSRLAVSLSMLCAGLITSVALAQGNANLPGASLAAALQQSEPTGRLIIKYNFAEKPGQSPRGSQKVNRSILRENRRLALQRKLSDTRELVESTTSTESIAQLKAQADRLTSQSDIAYASVEYRRYPLLEPNDPLYQGSQNPGDQSYLFDGDYSVHAPGAWDITTGSENSIIGIIDTGILPEHIDLANRSVDGLGYDFVSADGPQDFFSANDGDGRDPDPGDPGDSCNGFSSSWHGTSVSSVAAGNSNNGQGIAGIDWNARLLHARALGICGGTDADIIDAVRWSAGLSVDGVPDNPTPVNVVNLSLGGATECTRAWQDVIDELGELGIVFVLAAGNEALNALRISPANCANVVAVGSSTPDGSIDRGFSNHGLKVTISTNGRDLVVAANTGFNGPDEDNNFYRTETGTSFSAAIISGGISLMHSLDPNLGPSEIRALLYESATPFASDTECDLYNCGGGVLNLSRALTMLRDNNFNRDRDVARELIDSVSTAIPLRSEVEAGLFGFKDIRYFALDIPERGLLQAESDSNVDLFGYLLNSELSAIAVDDDSGDATNFRIASLVEPGKYYIAVERERHRFIDGEVQFTLNTTLTDDTPDTFLFATISNATSNTVVESNTVTITGLQNTSILTIADGFYSLNGGEFSNTPAVVRNGDTLQLATQSPANANGSSTTTVTVGAFSTSFIVTTAESNSIISFAEGTGTSSSGCSIVGTGATFFDPLFLLSLWAACAALVNRSRSKSVTVQI